MHVVIYLKKISIPFLQSSKCPTLCLKIIGKGTVASSTDQWIHSLPIEAGLTSLIKIRNVFLSEPLADLFCTDYKICV